MKTIRFFTAILTILILTACNNLAATEPASLNPLTWGDQTLAQTIEKKCVNGAMSFTVDGTTYACPGTTTNKEATPTGTPTVSGPTADPLVCQATNPCAVTPTPTVTPTATVAVPNINLNHRTTGEVVNNFDDGNATWGTIVFMTRDDETTGPTLFLIATSYSIDVEYLGKMYFVTDRYEGTANIADAVALAEALHPGTADKVFVGPESYTPKGWTNSSKATGWWALKDWRYAEEPIYPRGLTATSGIFVSETQAARTIGNAGGVIYGQFWTSSNPGHVVHVQVRAGETLTVPARWQGTYWIWTGDFELGEMDLQKRMIQASAHEVSPRDDIIGFTLVLCGKLPEVDPEITHFTFHGQVVTWISNWDNFVCESK